MRGDTPSISGQRLGFVPNNVTENEHNNENRSATNVSVQTGEEFSEIFLRDGVSPRRAALAYDIDQKQKIMDNNSTQNNHFGINTGDSIGGTEYFDFSPKRCGFNAGNEDCSYAVSIYNKENTYTHQQREMFSNGSNSNRIASGPTGTSLQGSSYSKQASTCVSQVKDGSLPEKIKFLCSFGGRILPRPNDGKLRYAGGETRIISIRRNLAYSELVRKTTGICNQPHIIKYQLPGEDLDALISVASDEDFQLMIEEHDLEGSSQKLRIFLVALNDSESPSSSEGKTPTKSDTNYQYVVAVNGILDSCIRRSTSRESLASPASQASQSGSTMEYSPTIQRETSTSIHPLHIQNEGSSSKMRFASLTSQFLNTQASFKPYFGSPFKDSKTSDRMVCEDFTYVDSHEFNCPNSEQLVHDNMFYSDASSCYNNQPSERVRMKNHDQLNSPFTEFKKTSKPPFYTHKLSKKSVNSPSRGQSEANKKRLISEDKGMHFQDLIASQDKGGLFPENAAAAGKCHRRITRAFSDAQLYSEDMLSLTSDEETNPSRKFVMEKSPSFSGLSQYWSSQHSEDSDKNYLHHKSGKQMHLQVPEQTNEYIQWSEDKSHCTNTKVPSLDQDGARCRVGSGSISHTTAVQHQINLPKINLAIPLSPAEQNYSLDSSSAFPSPCPENSRNNRRGQPREHRLVPDVSDLFAKCQKETKDQENTVKDTLSRNVAFVDSCLLMDEKKNYCSSFKISNPISNDFPFPHPGKRPPLDKELNVKEMQNLCQRKDQNSCYIVHDLNSDQRSCCEKSTFGHEMSTLYQPNIKHIGVTMPESIVIVEDVTGNLSECIGSPSEVVPLVQDEPSDGVLSPGGETEVENTTQETDDNEVSYF